jgi:hypothetical protein
MAAVNDAILAREKLPNGCDWERRFARDLAMALFDIRELAWHGIMICHASSASGGDGANFS